MISLTRNMLRTICVSFAAFGFAASAHAESIDVVSTSYTAPMVKALAAAFEERNPGVELKLQVGPRSDDDLAQALLRYKTVGQDLPDLLILGSNQRLLAESGITIPVSDMLDKSSALMSAPDVMLVKPLPDGKIFGIAFGISIPIVLFNTELVKRAGGDPDHLPTDWAGIISLAKKINALGSPIIGGYIQANSTGAFALLYLLQSVGERMMDANETKLTIDTPKAIESFSVLTGFGEAGQDKAAMSADQARHAFGAGTIGVFVTTSGSIAGVEEAAGDRFSVRSVPFPVAENGTIPASRPMVSIMTKDSLKYPTIRKFLDFVVSPEGQTVVAKTSGYFPTSQKSIDASAELKALLADRPNAPSVLRRLDKATDWYAPPHNQSARVAKIVSDNLMNVVALTATPEQAAKAMTKEIGPLVEKAN
ncbi:ABC-type glycerol-3-phosphate transport system substrate-binding protein [Ensifer sp. SEMIA 135]|uniref:extracellular solute-binding protein n=1 Tax=Rhizobium meliloti TaxID=382 RepID=UPI000FDA99DE|nr:extracellular solute-binding protein [Sinorhizobium meliloti]RVL21108.1 extracellular solute-binding protein [Sinorhizobium meliloti]RVP94618.1 extracellular solute-binding protein [Sinorhizobium meliloti]TWA88496.1 ABC-type glycerol-3-phosphate transport system substrate-binding protein [Ensifer sp. SEMIA 134]TWB24030.1 ABC-type glycerol-3-phosphate transport system substrate-binding protein [Ensifer sp. SEMIA 135]